jgi:hypothetical protein
MLYAVCCVAKCASSTDGMCDVWGKGCRPCARLPGLRVRAVRCVMCDARRARMGVRLAAEPAELGPCTGGNSTAADGRLTEPALKRHRFRFFYRWGFYRFLYRSCPDAYPPFGRCPVRRPCARAVTPLLRRAPHTRSLKECPPGRSRLEVGARSRSGSDPGNAWGAWREPGRSAAALRRMDPRRAACTRKPAPRLAGPTSSPPMVPYQPQTHQSPCLYACRQAD